MTWMLLVPVTLLFLGAYQLDLVTTYRRKGRPVQVRLVYVRPTRLFGGLIGRGVFSLEDGPRTGEQVLSQYYTTPRLYRPGGVVTALMTEKRDDLMGKPDERARTYLGFALYALCAASLSFLGVFF